MKKQLFVFAGLLIITVTLVSWNFNSKTYEPAQIIREFDCALLDGDGNFYITDVSKTVISDDGTTLKCRAKGVPNSTGHAVERYGFLCGTQSGYTYDSKETVSASGNATLTCSLAPSNP